jgi:hypothetical protein
MKKYTLSIALLALTAFFAFLAACGGEEPENLDGSSQWQQIRDAITTLTEANGPIEQCYTSDRKDECPDYSQSSPSGEPEPPSSPSGEPEPPSSPSGEPSSPSGGNDKPDFENCPDDQKASVLANIESCGWKPKEVEAGDNATFEMKVKSGCTAGQAWLDVGVGNQYGIALFPANTPVKTSGSYPSMEEGSKVSFERTQWPKEATAFKVNGSITCGNYTCLTDENKCTAMKITKAGEPTSGNVTLTCNEWPTLKVGTNNLSIGAQLKSCTTTGTPGNTANAGCKSSAYLKYCDGKELSDCNTGSAGELKVEVAIDCKGGTYTLAKKEYTVVADPNLTGTCAWSDNNKSPVSSAKGSKPSGVSLKDSYGRCGTLSDGALPISAYGGNGVASWPPDGIVAANTYNAVKTNVTCTPAITTQASCPTLVVNAGAEHHIDGNSDNEYNKTKGANLSNGECLDLDFTWNNSGWTGQRIDVRCDNEPQFVWNETVNKSRKGCIKVTHNGTSDVNCGDYDAIAKVTVIPSTTANGVYEILGVCAEIYYGSSDGTKLADVGGSPKAKCRASVNGN